MKICEENEKVFIEKEILERMDDLK